MKAFRAAMVAISAVAGLFIGAAQASAEPPSAMDQQLTGSTVAQLAETAYEHIGKVIMAKVGCDDVPREAILGELEHPFEMRVLEEARALDPLGVYLHVAIKAAKFIGDPQSGCAIEQVSDARSACHVGSMVQAFVIDNGVTVSSATSEKLRQTIYTAFDEQIASLEDAALALDDIRIPAGVAGYDMGVRNISCNNAEEGKSYRI